RHLVDIVTQLEERKVGLRSLSESIDTTSPGGKLIFHIFCSLAEFERALVRERTAAGLAAARARGRLGGRPRALSSRQAEIARAMYESRRHTVQAIADTLKVSPSSIYRYVRSAADGTAERARR
ncbi:MAG: recombinase family protein, partial [Actinomycetota bacterium]